MTTHALAAQYIRDQIRIIRKHGGTPKLTADQLRKAIASAERTFEAMRARQEGRVAEVVEGVHRGKVYA